MLYVKQDITSNPTGLIRWVGVTIHLKWLILVYRDTKTFKLPDLLSRYMQNHLFQVYRDTTLKKGKPSGDNFPALGPYHPIIMV